MAAVVALSLRAGIQFRSGPRGNDLAIYRNTSLPRALRNWQSVAPLTMLMLMPAVLGSGLLVFDIQTGIEVSGDVGRFIMLGGESYFLIALAITSVLLFRPPRALIPRWLKDDDDRIGYQPPAPNWFDFAILGLVGVPAFLVGTATLAMALSQLGGPSS
jgi:hypothetical protein